MSRIILHTEVNAENNAMLQALYSRSASSVTEHLKKLEETGSSKFMSQYYLGYGHASIGQGGNETLYFEGISMLAAKAIEDLATFAGQECSSRYIDFSTQPFYNPAKEDSEKFELIEGLYAKLREFYTSSLEPLRENLKQRFPIKDGEKSGTYEKAIAARAFDILRGFLPASATTNVAWTSRLSDAHEHLVWMMHHPLDEVQMIGARAYSKIQQKYPNSFRQDYAEVFGALRPIRESLLIIEGKELFEYSSLSENFYSPLIALNVYELIGLEEDLEVNIRCLSPIEINETLKNRPKRAKLPKHEEYTQTRFEVESFIDFGSFRDLQRHRNGYCSMPVITPSNGLHPWYFNNLPRDLQKSAEDLLMEVYNTFVELTKDVDENTTDKEAFKLLAGIQYIAPMGSLVFVNLKYSLQQMIYVAELRSGKTVHATLRPLAQRMGAYLEAAGVTCHYDKDENDWTIKRGEQDIIAKI